MSVIALATWVAASVPAARAAAAPVGCGSRMSVGDVETVLARVANDRVSTEESLRGSAAASPAAWRLHEQQDTLEWQSRVVRELRNALATRAAATPGWPAQWRAQESADALCAELQTDA
jgi:hypothetical protein